MDPMSLNQILLSVVIPAYNQPVYLRRALESVVDQDYRPLEVIVADDCSPQSLEPVVKTFASLENGFFTIRYLRQPQNQGFVDNFRSAIAQAKGKYLVPLPHDNRFIDPGFFAESVKVMSASPGCHLAYANAVYEHSHRQALNIPAAIPFRDGWALMGGNEFIRLYRRGGMDFSQTAVIDHEMALALKAYGEPFAVNGVLARRLGIAQDDVFSYVFILSAMGSVALSQRPVCEIGTPPESYSRSHRSWKHTKGKVKFVIFYNIYRADLKGRFAADVKRMAFRQALQYADRVLDVRIARYYRWSPRILLLMGLGLVQRCWNELRYAFKRAVNVFRPGTFKKTSR
jgi:glycosyltransferase involved in cell wall biosynthesis